MSGVLSAMKELKGTLNSVKQDLDSLNKTVSILVEHQSQSDSKLADLQSHMTSKLAVLQDMLNASVTSNTEKLNHLMDTFNSKLASVNASVRKEFRAVESQLEEHKTTSGLADLHAIVHTHELNTKLDTLESKLASVNASMRVELRAVESQLQEHNYQMISELANLQSNMTSSPLISGLEQTVLNNVTRQLQKTNDYLHNCLLGNTREGTEGKLCTYMRSLMS